VTGASMGSAIREALDGVRGVRFADSPEEVDRVIAGYWRDWLAGSSLFWDPRTRRSPFDPDRMLDAFELGARPCAPASSSVNRGSTGARP
jgi:hypothetical protein